MDCYCYHYVNESRQLSDYLELYLLTLTLLLLVEDRNANTSDSEVQAVIAIAASARTTPNSEEAAYERSLW